MSKGISELVELAKREIEYDGECTFEVVSYWKEPAGCDPIQCHTVCGIDEDMVINALRAAGLKVGHVVESNELLITQ